MSGSDSPQSSPDRPAQIRHSVADSTTTDLDTPDLAAVPLGIPADAFPGYELIRELSRGGQGVVYQAIQAHTQRKVAIKVLREGLYASKSARLRFEREIQLAAQLRHPSIISIFHSGVTGEGRQFYVMDYVRGASVQRYVREKKLALEDTLVLFAAICDAVQVAHQRGIIHRDLKPSNILVDADEKPHILDFGLAKGLATPVETAVSLTQDVLGTLPYMSPEQAVGSPDELDVRSDVYSLGVLLYELLTGGFPYPVAGRMVDIVRHIAGTPPTPANRRWNPEAGITQRTSRPVRLGECPLDSDVQTIVLKALAKERERRYPCAGELADDLRHYLAGEPLQARRDSLAYIAWARARRVVQRRPLTTLLAGLVLITLVTQYVVAPAVYRWSPLNWYYEATLTALPRAGAVPTFDYVRVIGLTDKTNIAGLVQAAGLATVSAENLPSLRRLHGAFMERLAHCGLRALVWDIRFGAASEFDDDLVRGIQAMRERGTDVLVSTRGWNLDEAGLPALSPAILPHVKWGVTTGDFSAERPWSLDLVVERRGREPMPSLALLAAAAYCQPGAEAFVMVTPSRQTVTLRYWKPTPTTARARQWLEGGNDVRLTGLWALPDDDDEYGLRHGDVIGHYFVTIPADDVLNRSTLDYQDVFMAGEPRLRDWLAGRVAVVGDLRTGIDRYPYPDGRTVAGCHGHAAAIEAILSSVSIRAPTVAHTWLMVVGATVLGALAVWPLYRYALRWAVLLAMLAVLVGGAAVGAYRSYQYLVNPLVPVFALVVAGTLVAFVRRNAQVRSN